MSKSISLYLLYFFMLGGLILALVSFFLPSQKNGNTINAPVAIEASSVTFAGITYGFSGEIKEIINQGNNINIILAHMEPGIEKFSSCTKCPINEASVNYKWNNWVTKTNFKSLKTKQKVVITATYDLKKNMWSTSRITILAPPPPSPTPTPRSSPLSVTPTP